MKKITIVAGARPNFVKIAPIIEAIKKARAVGAEIGYRLVHTGQHYDRAMSGSFFRGTGYARAVYGLTIKRRTNLYS